MFLICFLLFWSVSYLVEKVPTRHWCLGLQAVQTSLLFTFRSSWVWKKNLLFSIIQGSNYHVQGMFSNWYNCVLHLSHQQLDDQWVPEAAAIPASSKELEMKRFQLVKRQFQRVTVEQDCLIQDYQKRAKWVATFLHSLVGATAHQLNRLHYRKSYFVR